VARVPAGFNDGWTDHFRRRLAWLRPVEAILGKPRWWIADAVAWRVGRRDDLVRLRVTWTQPAIALGLKLIECYRPAVILATAPPFETLKAGLALHQQTGIPLVADFRDPWTYGVPWKPLTPKWARREKAWEARVVRNAAKVIVVTPSMQRTMKETYPEELVMNGYEDLSETDTFPPEDRFVLSYIGSVMERRLPAVLFEALRRLRTSHPDAAASVRLQLIGPNMDASSPTDRVRAEGLADMVEWLGPVSHNRARELMRSSHVLLHIESSATYAVSGKLFEYLAAGRPVLGFTPPGRRRVVPASVGGRAERRARGCRPYRRGDSRKVAGLAERAAGRDHRPGMARAISPTRTNAQAGRPVG
jgi:glycosyltransferase involved in cell wall biosynthesis